jgi:membrane protein
VAHATYPSGRWAESRGRSAERPRDIPAPGWRDILWRVKERMARDNLSIIAAGVAFYALMAIFPALIALVGLYGLLFEPQQVAEQVGALRGMLPPQAADILLGQLTDLTQMDRSSLGVGSIVATLFALWSASSGMRTTMQALDVAYDEEEKRGTIRFYATALALTLGAIVAVVASIAVVVAIPVVIKFLGLGTLLENVISYARWPLLAAGMIAGLAVLYRYGPDRRAPQWRWLSWGAVIATLMWLVGSALFSLYVSQFGDYNKTYGSMAAVVILLTWFLLSAYVLLIGAEINAEMERQTRKDTTEGAPRPLGRRGARAADTVGRTP